MKILSIETSTMLGGIAIMDQESGLIAETRLNVKTTHSERLMNAIRSTLLQAELHLDDISAFAVAIGPGSFTGLRIGLSTAKGLAYSTGNPLITVPTLEAFAWNFPFSKYPVCVMLDARKKEVYAAVFEWQKDNFMRRVGELSIRPLELLRDLQDSVVFAGEAVLLYKELITETMGERAFFASREKMVPSPSNVAMLGMLKAAKADYTDPAEAVPMYIRKSEAEIKWSEKSK
jgi:tRNA threonylcarbamoyladenosine biosynthesis protein TsaB